MALPTMKKHTLAEYLTKAMSALEDIPEPLPPSDKGEEPWQNALHSLMNILPDDMPPEQWLRLHEHVVEDCNTIYRYIYNTAEEKAKLQERARRAWKVINATISTLEQEETTQATVSLPIVV